MNTEALYRKLCRASALAIVIMMFTCGDALAEVIRNFDVDVYLKKDAALEITETITMDFENAHRHGILRFIPIRFRRYHNSYTTPLKVVEITDKNGVAVAYKAFDHHDDFGIKIGDKDVTVSGVQVYKIRYQVRRAVNFFNDNEPEVYWNATGNEWPFAIDNVRATFHTPMDIDQSKVRVDCFIGPQGSTTKGQILRRGNGEIVFTAQNLAPSEGLTFVIGLPAGSISKPSPFVEWFLSLIDWWPAYILPIAMFGGLYRYWLLVGRDPGNINVAGVEWNPPKDLAPAEVGTLMDERCDINDIVSTIIDLATRGYLQIREIKPKGFIFSTRDYEFIRLKVPVGELKNYEDKVFNGIFGESTVIQLSDLKYKFYEHLSGIKNYIYEGLEENGHFTKNPEQVRRMYNLVGLFAGCVGLCFLFGSSLSWGIGLLLSAIVILLFGQIMPARTLKGVEACRQCVGFKRFVHKAEKERIRVLANDDPTIFGRLLPYALVLGAADIWAEKFQDLLTQPPDWFEPYGMRTGSSFNSMLFVNDLGGSMQTMRSSLSAPPPTSSSSGSGGGFSGFSSGGGFSGGGSGGGGGGSW